MSCCTEGLLRLSDGLENLSFRWEDIPRFQVKSNLTVGKNLVNADQHLFWKKEVSFIYNDFFFQKKSCLCCTQRTAQSVRWPCKPIILSIGHFEGSTEIQLSNWWEAVSPWSVSSLTKQANIFKVNEHFLKCIVLKFIHLEQIGSESIVKRLRIGYETVGNIKVVSTDSFKQPEVANKVD